MDWIRMGEGEWIRRGGEKKEKRRKKENKEKEKIKIGKGHFRHFTISIQPVKPFCQTFSKTASAPSEKPLHQRSQSRSRFWRIRSPAKQALNTVFTSLTSYNPQFDSLSKYNPGHAKLFDLGDFDSFSSFWDFVYPFPSPTQVNVHLCPRPPSTGPWDPHLSFSTSGRLLTLGSAGAGQLHSSPWSAFACPCGQPSPGVGCRRSPPAHRTVGSCPRGGARRGWPPQPVGEIGRGRGSGRVLGGGEPVYGRSRWERTTSTTSRSYSHHRQGP
jgi:hypothetical protein